MTWVRVLKGNTVRHNRQQYTEGQEIDISNPQDLVSVGAVVIVERQQPVNPEPVKEVKEDINEVLEKEVKVESPKQSVKKKGGK